LSEKGNCFQTDPDKVKPGAKHFEFVWDDLLAFFADTPAAHVLLLDVDRYGTPAARPQRAPLDKIARWEDFYPAPSHPHIGVLRYAWLGRAASGKDVGLLTALHDTLPRAGKLGDVASQLRKRAATSRNFPELLHFDQHLPSELSDLLVGR
jgi:hypothetical protein